MQTKKYDKINPKTYEENRKDAIGQVPWKGDYSSHLACGAEESYKQLQIKMSEWLKHHS